MMTKNTRKSDFYRSDLNKMKKLFLNDNKPFGLYLHVPFCEGKCRYCDFYSVNYNMAEMNNYLACLKEEIKLYSSSATIPAIETIYIGGGTPGLLTVEQLAEILDLIIQCFNYPITKEISIEANPYSLTEEKIAGYRGLGVNRLSLGVQSFNDRELNFLGRKHTASEAIETINLIDRYFNNYSIDLIFAIPGQRVIEWQETLEKAIALNPNHISLYNLQIEEGTPLAVSMNAGEFEAIDDTIDAEMYILAQDMLVNSGYQHYEISNFAKPNFYSRHNRLYWELKPYLGLGPAAHSFTGNTRFNNYSDIYKYNKVLSKDTQNQNFPNNNFHKNIYEDINKNINKDKKNNKETASGYCNTSIDCLPIDSITELTKEDLMAEKLFMGLRLLEGVSLGVFYEEFGIRLEEYYHQEIKNLQSLGLIELNKDRMKLTKKGLLHGNRVFMEFLP